MWGNGERVVRTGSSSSEVMADRKVVMTMVMLLQVLTNSVMDTTTPYDHLHQSEIAIHENDVRSFLSNPSTSKPLENLTLAVVRVGSLFVHTGDLTEVTEGFDENLFILQRGPGQDLRVGTTSMCLW